MRIPRKSKIAIGIAVVGLLTLSACSGGGSDPGSSEGPDDGDYTGEVLIVGEFGGPAKEAVDATVGEAFRKLTGATVEYVEGNPSSFRSQLLASPANPPFDVMRLGPVEERQLQSVDMLDPLDYSQIPNSSMVSPAMLKSDYMVAVDLYEVGIAYDADKFAENGLKAPEVAEDLFQPGLEGRVSFPELGVVMSPVGITALAMEEGGSESDVVPGFEYLAQQDIQYFYPSSSELATRVTSGEVWAAWWHSGWPPRLTAEVPGFTFASAAFEDYTGFGNYTGYSVPKGAKQAELANIWINLSLDADTQAKLNTPQFVLGTTKEARAIQDADPNFPIASEWLQESHLDNLYFLDYDVVAKEIDGWVDLWRENLG